ncbi:molybdopterin molybdotransferase MoeA [Corynebacterium sp. CCM 8862]|uniref:Molybdopterin molybdenumtransferase n=1 Tax=Corynebacterium mendelii TaxID=2765362 RepID=A0A939E0Z1_9CORY|nr:gephyrin-like molybdotransferase Glp [Corynebacterium mendelii]MBN9643833.1 molybdopterin molybdotransferase MoeA [Corynebacterium mendelii]
MLDLDDHIRRIMACARPLAPVYADTSAVRGMVLAEDATAGTPMPVFDNSAMDGYAVRRGDVVSVPATLEVVADIPAGSPANPVFGPGQCARIMTGAAVPDCADAVVPLEQTTLGTAVTGTPPSTVTVTATPGPGAHIRKAGEDVHAGEVVAEKGQLLGARAVSALVACGVEEVAVHPLPRVAVVSTGSELIEPGYGPLERGQIYNSNTPLIANLVAANGCDLSATFHADDVDGSFIDVMEQAAILADVVITTGGVSVGAFDVVRLEMERSGWDIRFDKIAMQPGKPQGFGRAPDGTLVFCLPGNPVSAFVSFEAFVRPALHALSGRTDPVRRTFTATAAQAWKCPQGRAQFMPVVIEDGTVRPATAMGSGSHLVGRLAAAQALAFVPATTDAVHHGDTVEVWEITQ